MDSSRIPKNFAQKAYCFNLEIHHAIKTIRKQEKTR